MADTRTIIMRGGGSSGAILLLFVAIVGLVALFTGNLDRWIGAVAGSAGGAEGLTGDRSVPYTGPELGAGDDYATRHPELGQPAGSAGSGATAANAARAAGFPV